MATPHYGVARAPESSGKTTTSVSEAASEMSSRHDARAVRDMVDLYNPAVSILHGKPDCVSDIVQVHTGCGVSGGLVQEELPMGGAGRRDGRVRHQRCKLATDYLHWIYFYSFNQWFNTHYMVVHEWSVSVCFAFEAYTSVM